MAKVSSQRARLLSRAKAARVFGLLHERWPEAHCELKHHNSFQLLVAVVLSAQATDVGVNRAFGAFCDEHPKFGAVDLVEMGEKGFLKIIKSIGLAPTKARNCFRLAGQLVAEFNGKVPRTREELESLPGVGRKTANVVLNVLYGEATMAVDTHVARLAQRIGLVAPTSNREKIEAELLRLVPEEFAQNAHHTLIFHGRYHCKARNPDCESCPLGKVCLQIGV